MATAALFALSAPANAQPWGNDQTAPVLNADQPNAVKDRYIVVFKSGVTAQMRRTARAQAETRGAAVQQEYGAAINAFAATLTPVALDNLRHNPNVSFIEADRTVSIDATESPAPWGLDRIDQRGLPLNNAFTTTATGAGVTAYIIDTGIRFSHVEFGGRAVSGVDAIDGGPADDCNGHGTHVSGTIGGTTYGIAKAVKLVAVRVLDCTGSGTVSQVIAGLNWVVTDHQSGQPAVANMSLGGGLDTALDAAVQTAIQDGITYTVAAGNSNVDACTSSPGDVAAAITVGATTSTDARASYSNYGACLDIFAPGSSITSSWFTSDTALAIASGTSMASPHVAGVAALYLQGDPGATPTTVRDAIVAAATPNAVTSAGTASPNRLLYANVAAAAPAPTAPAPAPTPTPTPTPTFTCTGYPATRTGTLAANGRAVQPDNGYYYARAGTHRGCLDGPLGANFDLYLYRWSGSSWVTVASGTTLGADELVTYSGTAGYYFWLLVAKSGQGSYTFGMQRP